MMKLGRILLAVLLMITMMSSAVIAADKDYGDELETIMQMILNDYIDNDELTEEELYEAAVSGMFSVLDKYSGYIPPANAENYNNSLNNTYVGIGVQLIQTKEYVVIDRVFFDGPAEKGGLLVHDKIIGVDGESIVGKTPQDAANLIIGEEGTEVVLTIDRSGYVFDVTLVRSTIVLKAVNVLDLKTVMPDISPEDEARIGYLELGSFSSNADEELEEALAEFKSEGKDYLLLDLRNNGGGYVTTGVNVLNQLVPEGLVVYFEDNDGGQVKYYSNLKDPSFTIVAIINENSASATEFVAAAIQESGVGTLVGETTFGKGVAQYLYTMPDGAVVKLTQDEFYSGAGVPIHEVGVTPDVVIEIPDYLTKEVKYHRGDWYDSVANLEKMLQFLGYTVGPIDHVYDDITFNAVKQFQADQGIYPYGVCDFTTQDTLNQALIEHVRENDIQLEAGLQLILSELNK